MQEWIENWPYAAWALSAAMSFYATTVFGVSHLHPDKKAALSLWLEGSYESTWTTQFCSMFDGLFGAKHFGLLCFLRSAIASVLAVLALWLLFDQVLGLISVRTTTSLSLWQALLLGAAINILPDYLSLYETRWLLKQFERVRNPVGQLAILLADAIVSGLIIYAGIKLYLWGTDQPQVSAVEMLALFSFYSVFFYSTFLTSIWAWAYCLSSWLVRVSARLQNWLDVAGAPGQILAFLGASLVFVCSFAVQPILHMDENGRTPLDTTLCEWFSETVCHHVVRLTKDDMEKLDLLGRACQGGVEEECYSDGFQKYDIAAENALRFYGQSCDAGNLNSCKSLGYMYSNGLAVAKDDARAVSLYRQACDGGDALGCNNLGSMYQGGRGVAQDDARAVSLYRQACDGGSAGGCANLGSMYRKGLGVAQDDVRAADLYRQACDGGFEGGCNNLGSMYQGGLGVAQDDARAVSLYRQACEGGFALGCSNLGSMYRKGLGVAQDDVRAADLYRQACDGGDALGCSYLGSMYQGGRGVAQDDVRAASLYRQACDGGDALGCANLGSMYRKGLGVAQDDVRAASLYRQACDGGDAIGCFNLGSMYQYSRGVAQDDARAADLYRQACEGGYKRGCTELKRFEK